MIKKIKIKTDLDIYSSILICLVIGGPSIQQGVLSFIRTIIILPLKLDVIIFYSIYAFALFKSLSFLKTVFEKDVLFLLLFFYSFFAISFFLPNTPSFIVTVLGQLTFSLICYTLARSVKNFETLFEALRYLAFPMAISVILQLVFFQSNLYVEDYQLEASYNQFQGYLALSAAIISLSFLMNRFSYFQLFTFLISASLIVIIGARGPLVCLIIFYFFKLLYNNLLKPKGLGIILISICLVGIVYIFYFNEIIELAGILINKYGLSSRLIDFANSDNFIEDENRNRLLDSSIELIKLNPIFGLGMAQDRIPLNSILMGDPDDAIGNYPHNIFIELFLHFGVIIGSILIISISRLLYLSLIKNDDFYSKEVIFIFLGIGLFPLFFSGSYLNAPFFFFLLGFCYNAYFKNRILNNVFS